jgi:glycosyltransferase involved in cell wall biosynthesis
MRTTLYKLLKRFTDAGKLPEPIYEFGAYRTPGQESRGHVRDYFASMRFVGCDMRPGRILFTGRQEDIENYYAAADVVALPALQEAFGNVVLEALASACFG